MEAARNQEPPRATRGDVLKLVALGTVASLIGVALALLIDWFPAQSATAADDIDLLYDVLLAVSVPIFVLVMTIAIYCVVKFRARPGDRRDGAPIHGNTRLEVIWVTIPFIIVTVLAIYSWVVLDDIEARQPDERTIDVTGVQFTWQFRYPEERVRANELVLPIGEPVKFRIRANDVIHSFWVPEFRLKQDAVPGLTTEIRVTPNRSGNWQVVCAELCGIGHATMRVPVRVVSASEFDRWVTGQREEAGGDGAEQPSEAPAEAGAGGGAE